MKYLGILFVLFSAACSNNKNITSSNTTNNSEEASITLARTGCFGTCHVYNFKIQTNGKVNYTGKAYVDNIGTFEAQIDEAKIKRFFATLTDYKWKSYPEKYPVDNVDFPQFKLIYNSAKISKEIKGNSKAAEELISLTKELDDLIKDVKFKKVEEQ